MNRYEYIVKREVSYIEEIHMQIVAKTEEEAVEIADQVGNDGLVNWPSVDRYNVYERTPLSMETVSIEKTRG